MITLGEFFSKIDKKEETQEPPQSCKTSFSLEAPQMGHTYERKIFETICGKSTRLWCQYRRSVVKLCFENRHHANLPIREEFRETI